MNKSLKFLGTESGFGNYNNSAYFEINDEFVLIDCGFTVFRQLKEKINFKNYTKINVIITHLHNDHCGTLSQLILYLWFVYGKTVNVITKCKNMGVYLDITGTPKEAYTISNNYRDLIFIETQHVEQIDCYGFKISVNEKKIIYTGDTKTIKPFLNYLVDTNELYVDVSRNGGVHIKFEDVISKLEQIKEEKIDIYLMHIDDYDYIFKLNNKRFYFA